MKVKKLEANASTSNNYTEGTTTAFATSTTRETFHRMKVKVRSVPGLHSVRQLRYTKLRQTFGLIQDPKYTKFDTSVNKPLINKR